MNRLSALPFLFISAPALAHPGHIAEAAGHAHWVALGATLLAVASGVVGVARALARRRRRLARG
jgi:hypothetical protein